MTKRECCDALMVEHTAQLYGAVMGKNYTMATTALVCHECGQVDVDITTRQEFDREVEALTSKRHSTAEVVIAYGLVVMMILFILMSFITTQPGVAQ